MRHLSCRSEQKGSEQDMLRGIDVKQMILQTNSVEKVQQTQQQHPDMQQRYLEIQINEQKKQHKEQVSYSEEAEKARIGQKKEEEKRKGAPKREQKNQPGETDEKPRRPDQPEGEEGGGPDSGTAGQTKPIHIDIKV